MTDNKKPTAWHQQVGARDIREMLAWCQGRAIQLQVGPGGIPGLTAEDVAGAVGLMTPGLPTRTLLYLHWRACAGPAREFEQMLLGIIAKESLARLIEYGTAKLAHDEALANYEDSTHHTERQHSALRSLGERVRALKGQRFPDQPIMWPRVRDAVLYELSRPNFCPLCDGRGECRSDIGLMQVCSACEGRGLVPVSDSQRARSIKRDESTYRDVWRPMYEWLYRILAAAELAGCRELRKRLFGKHEPVPETA